MSRRLAPILSVILATLALLSLAACSSRTHRDFARYYDERGLFMVSLPAANEVTVTPPQRSQRGPGLLTGVVSSPPAPSPSPPSAIGGFDPSATEEPDQTIYQAFAVTTDRFKDLDAMALYFLTADPVVDVVIDDPIRLDDRQGRLIVADVRRGGEVTASVAAAMTLGDGETGYLIAAVFPPDTWETEQPDFEEIVASLRSDLPPGLETFPVAAQAS